MDFLYEPYRSPIIVRGFINQKKGLSRTFIKAYGKAQHTKYGAVSGWFLIKNIHKAPKKGPTEYVFLFLGRRN